MKVDAQAHLTVATEADTLEGICRDISGSGMLIEMGELIPVGTKVEVVIVSDHGHHPMLRAIADVTRVEPGSEVDNQVRYLVGMRIDELLN